MIARFPNWQNRLVAYITPLVFAPHVWGKHDCALFSAGCIEAMTGVDLAEGLRGYRTLNGGLKRIKRAGYDSHVDVFAQHLKASTVNAAKLGDVAIIDAEFGEAVGIVQGDQVYILGHNGLNLIPILHAKRVLAV